MGALKFDNTDPFGKFFKVNVQPSCSKDYSEKNEDVYETH